MVLPYLVRGCCACELLLFERLLLLLRAATESGGSFALLLLLLYRSTETGNALAAVATACTATAAKTLAGDQIKTISSTAHRHFSNARFAQQRDSRTDIHYVSIRYTHFILDVRRPETLTFGLRASACSLGHVFQFLRYRYMHKGVPLSLHKLVFRTVRVVEYKPSVSISSTLRLRGVGEKAETALVMDSNLEEEIARLSRPPSNNNNNDGAPELGVPAVAAVGTLSSTIIQPQNGRLSGEIRNGNHRMTHEAPVQQQQHQRRGSGGLRASQHRGGLAAGVISLYIICIIS